MPDVTNSGDAWKNSFMRSTSFVKAAEARTKHDPRNLRAVISRRLIIWKNLKQWFDFNIFTGDVNFFETRFTVFASVNSLGVEMTAKQEF
jgi:hypothetical protein